MGRPPVRLLPVALLLFTPGCAALLGKPLPPDYGASQEPRCSGFTLPLIDTVIGGISAIGVIAPSFVEDNILNNDKAEVGRRALGPTMVFGASAIYGYVVAVRCKSARRAHAAFEPFPVFAKRTYTEPACTLTAASFPDHGELTGTVVKGLDSSQIKAVFHGEGDSWGCDPLASEATSSAGIKRAACLILRDDCRPQK